MRELIVGRLNLVLVGVVVDDQRMGLAGEVGQNFYALDLKGPLAIVMGSEGEGMRRLTSEACDFLAQIPMRGAVESLNVSVATGVALFEALRQRAGVAK